jgi:redox-sensitive bicupin YhaK (pirin superfamily)
MQPIRIMPSISRGDGKHGFGIEVFYPGTALNGGDSGIGAIGRIDRARIQPGHVIGMHPHKDDEVFTYKRAGRMLHLDTVGNREEVTPRRLMMMNAGHSFQHEEHVIGDEPAQALQIFLRPRLRDLEPRVQFHEMKTERSDDAWRLLVAPEGATFEVRAQAWIRDAHLHAGHSLPLPDHPSPSFVDLLFVFSGNVRVGDVAIDAGQFYHLGDGGAGIEAVTDSDLVLFTTDTSAQTFKGGMFSANVSRG